MRTGALQDLSTFRNPEGFRGRPAWFVQLWWLTQSLLFHTSPQFMFGWRRYLLRLFGASIGRGVLIRPSARVTYPWKLSIGEYAWIGDHVDLYTLGPISIGENSVVSQGCYLCTGTHDYKRSDFAIHASAIVIGAQTWLAAQVFVGPGVTIGKGAVVGARSLVLDDIPEDMLVAGHPAVVIRSRLD